jgi:hypothetical protein
MRVSQKDTDETRSSDAPVTTRTGTVEASDDDVTDVSSDETTSASNDAGG